LVVCVVCPPRFGGFEVEGNAEDVLVESTDSTGA
jgi:hypothetical protein